MLRVVALASLIGHAVTSRDKVSQDTLSLEVTHDGVIRSYKHFKEDEFNFLKKEDEFNSKARLSTSSRLEEHDLEERQSNYTGEHPCCWKVPELSLWDDANKCTKNLIVYRTQYAAPTKDLAVEKVLEDLGRSFQRHSGVAEKLVQTVTTGCGETVSNANAIPISKQYIGDIKFIASNLHAKSTHLGSTDFAKESQAFELILGNALITFEPLRHVLHKFVHLLRQHVTATTGETVLDYSKAFPGPCFAGFTTDYKTQEEFDQWLPTANLRELMTKFYEISGNYFSSAKFENSADKKDCQSHRVTERVLDPIAHYPRFKMPLKSVGLGWCEAGLASLPNRDKIAWPWAAVMEYTTKYPRADTMDPPLSSAESYKLANGCGCTQNPDTKVWEECPAKLAEGGTRVPWTTGRLGYLVSEDSPLKMLSRITGIPCASGASNSAYVIMSTAETVGLNPSELVLMRLVLLGWMMPFQDHSMLEVMMGTARAFPGRSFPKWVDDDAAPTIEEYMQVHRTLIPDDFSYQFAVPGGETVDVTKQTLYAHVDMKLVEFNSKHGTTARYPGSSADTSDTWWTHEVFDFMMDEVDPIKAHAIEEGKGFRVKQCEFSNEVNKEG